MAAPAGGGEPSEASGAPTKDARPPEREGVDVERAPRPSCAECGSLSYTTAFLKDFGLAVCGACRKTHAKYDLVTKTAARETFLVPEAELAALPFTTKTNPRKQSWGRMKLYLRSAVEALSFARYGDAAGLMAEKRKRVCPCAHAPVRVACCSPCRAGGCQARAADGAGAQAPQGRAAASTRRRGPRATAAHA